MRKKSKRQITTIAYLAAVVALTNGCQSGRKDEPTENNSLEIISQFALQSDAVGMLDSIKALDAQRMSPKDAQTLICIKRRWQGSEPDPIPADLPPVAAKTMTAMQQYWRDVSLRLRSREEAEIALHDRFKTVLAEQGGAVLPGQSFEVTVKALQTLIEARSLYVLGGTTTPNIEFMLWRQEENQTFEVKLTERVQSAEVVFISDYVSRGWMNYLTCDYMGTGGWATDKQIVLTGTKAEWEAKPVKLLTNLHHEAQHFADYIDHASMEGAELEYRAKLSELALGSVRTHELLENFFGSAKNGRASAHAHAEYWLTQHLTQKIVQLGKPETRKVVMASDIAQAAKQLLIESTAKLKNLKSIADAKPEAKELKFLPD